MAKLKVHPIFLMMLLLWALSGNIAQYFLVLVSLLWHEAGHLVMAKLFGVKVKRITMLPFGARIEFLNGQAISYTSLIWIAAGGPIFTLLAYSVNYYIPSIFREEFIMIQLGLLCVNLLPIYPLDGFKLVEVYTKYNNSYVEFMHRYGNLVLIIFIVFFDNLLIKLINLLSYPISWFWGLIF